LELITRPDFRNDSFLRQRVSVIDWLAFASGSMADLFGR